MKVKNLTFADRYTEKLVLAAAVVYLLVVVWVFVISNPYRVEVAGRMLGPKEADQYVNAQASQLEDRLQGPVPEALRSATLPPYADLFATRLSAPITPPAAMEGVPADALAYAPWAGNRGLLPDIDEGPRERDPFITPQPPTPRPVVARAEMGQLAMDRLDEPTRTALLDRIGQAGAEEPFDAQWVSVRSALDLASFRESLLDPADENAARPLPRLWLDSVVVLDVQIERRRVMPDGSYTAPELLPPMPGRASWREALTQDQLSDEQATRLLGQARATQQRLLTPSFYPLATGHSELSEMEEGQPQEAGPPGGQPPEAYDPEQFEGGGGYGPDEGGYQERGADDPGLSDLSDRGGEGDGDGDGGPAAPTTEQRMLERAGPWGGSIFEQDHLAARTTDLAVAPGARYQYRARVVISNPLYQRTQVPESQQSLAETFALTGSWSPWSEPVDLPRKRYFYIVGGSRELGYLEVECWRFFRGLWRAATFRIQPGDPIGRASADYRLLERVEEQTPPERVDFAQNAFAVDVDFDYPLADQRFGGVSVETIRLLYEDDQRLRDRLREPDRRRREARAEALGLTLTLD